METDLKTCRIFLVELTCGGSSSQNATYIINTSPTASCTYSICPSSTGICRIRYKFIKMQYNHFLKELTYSLLLRFDFETFEMSDPVTGSVSTSAPTTNGGAIGDCYTDQFSIDGPNQGSPVICGTNTGQHSKNNCLQQGFIVVYTFQ